MSFTPLNEENLDLLREVSNIGMGHAATALSQMIGETVLLRVPKVTLADIADVPTLLGGAETVVAGITLQLLGDVRGNMLLVFPEESARRLVGRLLGSEDDGIALSEIGISTLKEVGNILASAYLTALGGVLHRVMIPSIPQFAFDMAGAVVDYVLIELSESGDTALLVETEFHGFGDLAETINGHFFLLPDPASLEVILAAVEEAK